MKTEKKRKPGFYWVIRVSRWEVAEWTKEDYWKRCGNPGLYADGIFQEILPTVIPKP